MKGWINVFVLLIRVPLLVKFLAYLAKMWFRLVLLERVDDLDVLGHAPTINTSLLIRFESEPEGFSTAMISNHS